MNIPWYNSIRFLGRAHCHVGRSGGMQDDSDISAGSTPRNAALDRQPRPQWVGRAERGTALALRLITWVALTLGRPTARVLLYPVCFYFLIFSSASHAASTQYLRKVLARKPTLGDAIRHCHAFVATLLDRVFLFNDQYARFDVRVHDESILADLTARGEGCFLLGAHMGSFEIIRALGRHNTGTRISLVMYEEHARKFYSVLRAVNPQLGLQVIALGNVDSMLKVEAALNQGEIIGMLGDRTFQGEGTVACRFLGEPAHFPTGPFRLAALLKRPIVLMFGLYRGGNRYDVHFERLVDTWQGPHAARAALLERVLHRYVERLEHYCRAAPYNWYNFYDFWR